MRNSNKKIRMALINFLGYPVVTKHTLKLIGFLRKDTLKEADAIIKIFMQFRKDYYFLAEQSLKNKCLFACTIFKIKQELKAQGHILPIELV